ncbi:hypothetical protein MP228_011010 [Amoeboaphelidium protococcarum]|nr:hypothetical protein MP228_011010 [Amoeboaphelidium protococcarum]
MSDSKGDSNNTRNTSNPYRLSDGSVIMSPTDMMSYYNVKQQDDNDASMRRSDQNNNSIPMSNVSEHAVLDPSSSMKPAVKVQHVDDDTIKRHSGPNNNQPTRVQPLVKQLQQQQQQSSTQSKIDSMNAPSDAHQQQQLRPLSTVIEVNLNDGDRQQSADEDESHDEPVIIPSPHSQPRFSPPDSPYPESLATLGSSGGGSDCETGSVDTKVHSPKLANMVQNGAANADAQSDYSKKRRPFVQRYKVCLIISGILFLFFIIAVVLCIIFFRQIGQAFVNGSRVEFYDIKIVRPDETGFTAQVRGRISNAGPINAKTSPMNVTIQYEGYDLGWMEMPAINLKMGAADIEMESRMTLSNKTAFVQCNADLMKRESFTWRLMGLTDVSVMDMISLSQLTFDKSVALQGMNGFPGLTVSYMDMKGDNKTINTTISADLVNKSPVSIEMGTMMLDMYYAGRLLGSVNTTVDMLSTGSNPMNFTGFLTKPPEGQNSDHFSQMFSNYVSGQDSIVACVGTGFTGRNNNTPSWLVATIKAMNMTVVLPPGQNLELITSLNASGIDMNFNTGSYQKPSISASSIKAGIKIPFDFPVQVLESRQAVQVFNGANIIGTMKTDWANTSNAEDPNQISTYIPESTLYVDDDQVEPFADFLKELFITEGKNYTFKGTADMVAETAVGTLTLTGIRFAQSLYSKGMLGLRPYSIENGRVSNPTIHNTTVVKGLSDQIWMQNYITLYSASDVVVHMGDVTLDVLAEGEKIGYTMLKNLTLHQGENNITCYTYFQPVSDVQKEKGMKLINSFMNRKAMETSLRGTASNSTQNPLLKSSISELYLTAPYPGLPDKLVQEGNMKINPFTSPFNKQAKASFRTENPFMDSMTLLKFKADITKDGRPMGSVDVVLDGSDGQPPVIVPAQNTIDTPFFKVMLDDPLSGQSIGSMFKGMVGRLNVNVTSHIEAKLGEYPMSVEYLDESLNTDISL